MSGISLTSSMQNNLLALQQTGNLMSVTQERLATGRKVNSATDNASAYFSAQQGYDKSTDLLTMKDDMGEALQKIKSAVTTVSSVTDILKQMKSLVQQAQGNSDFTARGTLMTQYNSLADQVAQMTGKDSNYKGTNLLVTGNDLVVTLGSDASSKFTVSAVNTSAAAATGGYKPTTGASWGTSTSTTSADALATDLTDINTAIASYQTLGSTLASSSTYIQSRVDFTQAMSDVFKQGADNLVNADMNQESANMLTLQTRNSLATSALSISNQASQAVLKLFG